MVYQQYFWQRNHQRRGHIWWFSSIFGREITKGEVIYGVSTVFLAEKSPKTRSYMVCQQYFWQRNHQRRGHIWCVNSIFGREITKTRSYMVCQQYFWQRNHQRRGHIWCICTVLADATSEKGVHVLPLWSSAESCSKPHNNKYIHRRSHTFAHTHTHTHTRAHTQTHTHRHTDT